MTSLRPGARLLPLAVAVATVVLPAGPAAAHTELVSSSVTPSDPVPASTEEVVLTFSGDVRPELSTVVVTGAAGQDLTRGRPAAEGGRLVQPLAAPLPAGTLTLAYRVVAADGHPLTGTLPFQVVAGAQPALPAAAATTAGTAAAAPPVVRPGPADDPAAASDGVRTGLLPVAGLAVGAGLLGLLLLRRRTARA